MIKYSMLILMALFVVSCSAPRPKNLGLTQTTSTGTSKTTLKPCGSKPNCVTSYIHNGDRDHYFAPIKVKSLMSKAKKKIIEYLKSDSNVKIITQSDSYLYAEFTSSIFGFVDDLELHFSGEGLIHFRSSSRVGYSDLGANKRRIKMIAKKANRSF